MACHECDTLHHLPELLPGRTLRCRSCNAVLLNCPRGGLDRPIALYLAAAILFIFANVFPFLTLDIQGDIFSEADKRGRYFRTPRGFEVKGRSHSKQMVISVYPLRIFSWILFRAGPEDSS